jgi:ABC-type transport system involved in multi-copper enzyme maturation permease subunit
MKWPRPHLYENPILTRELRTRMRGARAFWVLFAYLSILSLVLFITYATWWQSTVLNSPVAGAFRVGRVFYYTIFVVQALLVTVITPALTAGGISIEKEQRTFDLLTISLLPRTSVVVGKLFSALTFIALLLTASLPLVSMGFLLGGVSPDEVIVSYGLLLVSAFVYGAVGMACSAVAKNTTTATTMTYGVVLLLFFATLMTIYFPAFVPGMGNPNSGGLKAINPIGAVIAGTQKETYFGFVLPAWATALVLNGLLGTILTLVAVHRLDWPYTDRSGLLRLLVAVFVGLMTLAIGGVMLPGSATGWGPDVIVLMAIALICLSFLVPIFATADSLPEKNVFATLFNPRRLGRGEAPSGVLYLLLLTLFVFGILYMGQKWGSGHSGSATLASSRKALNGQLAGIGAAAGLTLAVVWMTGTLGVFLTALLKNRRGAVAALYGILLLTYLLPYVYVMSLDDSGNSHRKGSPLDNALVVSPLVAAMDITSEGAASLSTRIGGVLVTPAIRKQMITSKPLIPWDSPLRTGHGRATLFYLMSGFIFLFAAEGVRKRQLGKVLGVGR